MRRRGDFRNTSSPRWAAPAARLDPMAGCSTLRYRSTPDPSRRKSMQPRIAVVGTGAVGGYAGAHMAQAGEDVTFLDPWP
ncbi:MAG: ketopantoate reductase family protein, partial [Acetobacteraceae bacterium]